MATQVSCHLLDIPTDLLGRILSKFSCDDLYLCRGNVAGSIKNIISGTMYLEYLLCTVIDDVYDLPPPDLLMSRSLSVSSS